MSSASCRVHFSFTRFFKKCTAKASDFRGANRIINTVHQRWVHKSKCDRYLLRARKGLSISFILHKRHLILQAHRTFRS